MKKMKLIPLGTLVFGIASFMAYSNGAIASETSNNSEVSNKTLVEDEDFFKNINFEGVFDGLEILKDFSVPITEQEGVGEILSKYVGEDLAHFNRKLEGISSISYRIVHEGDKLSFVDFKVVESKSDEKQGGSPAPHYDCPDGLNYITTCYSESCVQETLMELKGGFSKGKTIELYNDGFGGIIICSDVEIR